MLKLKPQILILLFLVYSKATFASICNYHLDEADTSGYKNIVIANAYFQDCPGKVNWNKALNLYEKEIRKNASQEALHKYYWIKSTAGCFDHLEQELAQYRSKSAMLYVSWLSEFVKKYGSVPEDPLYALNLFNARIPSAYTMLAYRYKRGQLDRLGDEEYRKIQQLSKAFTESMSGSMSIPEQLAYSLFTGFFVNIDQDRSRELLSNLEVDSRDMMNDFFDEIDQQRKLVCEKRR